MMLHTMIRKALIIIVIISFAVVAGPASITYTKADTGLKERLRNAVVLFLGSCRAYVNNSPVTLDKSPEVTPVIKKGRVLVPVRFISESLGADVMWNAATNTAEVKLGDKVILLTLGCSKIKVNNDEVGLDAAAESIQGRIFVPLRALADALGKKIFWDKRGLIIISDTEQIIDSTSESEMADQAVALFEKPVSYQEQVIRISTGEKKVKIIRINPKDPGVKFEVNIPATRLNQTEDFEKQVKGKGAFAAVNANFFEAYGKIKDPIGDILVDGRLVFGQSGLTTIGITFDKNIVFSKPGTFVTGWTDGINRNIDTGNGKYDYHKWSVFEVNNRVQTVESAVLYTPERGESIDITVNGYIAVIKNNVVAENIHVQAPYKAAIPQNGYVVFFGEDVAEKWKGQEALKVGRTVAYEYELISNTNENFKWENMQWAVSGGPDLISGGQLEPPSTHPAFQEERFTTMAAPRTAAGITKNGLLLLVSVPSATIAELKEIMLSIGAFEAINLDGGSSSAMYYDGNVIVKPGRELVTILYVYFKKE